MSKVTVLKVDTSCAKCKRKVLQAVTGLHGTYTAGTHVRASYPAYFFVVVRPCPCMHCTRARTIDSVPGNNVKIVWAG
jgi:hypothetical protein